MLIAVPRYRERPWYLEHLSCGCTTAYDFSPLVSLNKWTECPFCDTIVRSVGYVKLPVTVPGACPCGCGFIL